MASLIEILRVRLLSIAHARQAAAIAEGPTMPPARTAEPVDRTTPPATISAMPAAIRRSKFSLNANQANRAVMTPSKFKISDAEAESVICSPYMSRYGPMAPPKVMAPSNQITSAPRGRTIRVRPGPIARTANRMPRPTPEPA